MQYHLPFTLESRLLKQDSGYRDALMHCRKSSLPRVAVAKARLSRPSRQRHHGHLTRNGALAALSTNHSADMQRSLGKHKTKLRRVLELAGTPARHGWHANNVGLRSSLPMPMRAVVATGTAGNEALHATMRTAMRQVYDVHRAVLRLKLDLFGHSHQIAHDAAIRAPPLRQMHRYAILARVLGRQLIDEQSWNAQCSAPTTTGLVQKEYNPLAAQRKKCVRVFSLRRTFKKGRRYVKRTSHLSNKNYK